MMSAVPSTPALLRLSQSTATSVQMSWADVSTASGYRLEFKIDGTNAWQQGATTGPYASTGTIGNLSPGVKYDFAVQAYNIFGSSALSNQTMLALPPLATQNPPASVGAAFNPLANQVQVSWGAAAGATSYVLYRNTTNNPNTAASIASLGAGAISYVDASPAPGAEYFYWVKALKGSVVSGFSNAAATLDTDRNVVVTTSFNVNPLLNVINFTQDMVSDFDDLMAWDPQPKLNVSSKIDTLIAIATENLIETPFNQIVSGTNKVVLSESGEVTGQVSGGISAGVSAAVGVTVSESITLIVPETYNATSRSWVVNAAAISITGNVSALVTGTVTVSGQTVGLSVSTPGTSFSATGSGQVTVAPHLSVNVAYVLNRSTHTIYQSPALALPPKTFNLNALVIP